MEDKYLICKDCGEEFLFSASEQEFYKEKGFENEPSRCRDCRRSRKQSRGNSGGGGGGQRFREDRPMFKAICAECGEETTVPFEPSGDRPIYCRDCFRNRRNRY